MATSINKFRFLHCCSKLLCSKLSVYNLTGVRMISSHQIIVQQFGDPNKVLEKRVTEVPPLKGNDVLVKMLIAPINPSDVNTIEGTYFNKPPLPAVIGNEGVGKIEGVGQNVKGLVVGDLVIPSTTCWGTWQTYNTADQEDVIKLPSDIPLLSAATISVNPSSAYRMLKDYVQLSPGDVIIQNGANSGVGLSVIQLAREWNIKTINIVRDRPGIDEMKSYLTSLGADYVVTEDFVRTPQMKELLKSLLSKPKLGLNCVGGTSATELIRHIDHGGVIVTYGGMSKRPVMVPTGALIFKEVKLVGYWNTQWNSDEANFIARLEMFADLCALIKKEKFVPPICQFFQLDDYKQAMQTATEGYKTSKVAFDMQQ